MTSAQPLENAPHSEGKPTRKAPCERIGDSKFRLNSAEVGRPVGTDCFTVTGKEAARGVDGQGELAATVGA